MPANGTIYIDGQPISGFTDVNVTLSDGTVEESHFDQCSGSFECTYYNPLNHKHKAGWKRNYISRLCGYHSYTEFKRPRMKKRWHHE